MWAPLFSFLLFCIYRTNGQTLVTIDQGPVQGSLSSDGQYTEFLGIPFATVDPENPFGDALAGPIFNEVFEANDDSAKCPQPSFVTEDVPASLDCLHINVFVPLSASPVNPLPVMVWIYGGGFLFGSFGKENFGPEYLVRHDVIVVTLNYRVGPYGFMCLDTPSVPGNTGLKDQQLGLRWVTENIAAFGGDINSITVFGESAGAMSIEFHILNQASNGLFHRAIMQSGSALVEGIVVPSRPSAPLEIVRYLGYETDSLEDALDIIKDLSPNDVIRASSDAGLIFKPCIEQSFEGVNNFIEEYPDITLESGQYENVQVIKGFNSHEQLLKYIRNQDDDTYFDQIQSIFFNRVNASFALESEEEIEIVAKIAQEFYIGSQTVNKDVFFEVGNFDSDIHFNHPIQRSVNFHLANSENIPCYQYVFAYAGELNELNGVRNHTEVGSVHGDDVYYVFKPANSPDDISPQDMLMIDRMTTMWTNFAKYGDPTPETSALLPVRWPAVTRDSRDYLYLDGEPVVDQKPLHDRIAFWDLLFLGYGEFYRMFWEPAHYFN